MRGFNDRNTVYLETGHFNSDAEAKEWGVKNSTGKYGYKNITINGEDVILCETNMAYENGAFEYISKAYDYLASFLPANRQVDKCDFLDAKTDVLEYLIKCFEEYEGVRFLDVFDEY